MDVKETTVVYFSPTGGTQKAAMLLAGALGTGIRECDITVREAEGDFERYSGEELVVFAIPVFGGRVPAPAVERIGRMKGDNTPAVLMAVYGNRACEDALPELRDTVCANGFVPAAAVMAVAEHSIMRRFASGRPDQQDEKELREFGRKIAGRLATATAPSALPALDIPGQKPYRKYDGVPFKPKAGKDCTGCGICAAECPAGAIPAGQPSLTDTERCISCMRCISVCPSHARSLNRAMLAVAEKTKAKAFQRRKANELIG